MLIRIPDVLTTAQVAEARTLLDAADWVDGKVTAGHQSAKAKDNMQLPEASPAARNSGPWSSGAGKEPAVPISGTAAARFPAACSTVTPAVSRSAPTWTTRSARMPAHGHRIRTDLSATLFFAGPDEYDGGELCVEDTYGVQRVKLPAGHMVLYPSTSLHHVTPVTRGARVCSFFWLQSMIRSDDQRTLLFDLDLAIQRIAGEFGGQRRRRQRRPAHRRLSQPAAPMGGNVMGGVRKTDLLDPPRASDYLRGHL